MAQYLSIHIKTNLDLNIYVKKDLHVPVRGSTNAQNYLEMDHYVFPNAT